MRPKTPGETRQNIDIFEDSEKINLRLYQEMIGSLMYLSNGTRPDITCIVSKLSQYLKDPRLIHMTATKRVYRYLKGTIDHHLFYSRMEGPLEASADASWCCTYDAKSYSGYTVKLGSSLISWKSKKQGLVALSTCEAELMSLCEGVREVKWIISVLSELNLSDYVILPVIIHSDSQATINWIKGLGPASRTKHINRKFYFVKDEYKRGNIRPIYTRSENMEADLLTKSLTEFKIGKCNRELGIQKCYNE